MQVLPGRNAEVLPGGRRGVAGRSRTGRCGDSRRADGCAWVTAAAAAPTAAPGATAAAAAPTESQREGARILKGMADYLAGLKAFTFTFRSGYDVVQPTGQKIEFGETRRVAMDRPNRLRVEEVASDGTRDLAIFDGRTVERAEGRLQRIRAGAATRHGRRRARLPGPRPQDANAPRATHDDPPPRRACRSGSSRSTTLRARTSTACRRITSPAAPIPSISSSGSRRATTRCRCASSLPTCTRRASRSTGRISRTGTRARSSRRTTFQFTPPKNARQIPFAVQLQKAVEARAIAGRERRGAAMKSRLLTGTWAACLVAILVLPLLVMNDAFARGGGGGGRGGGGGGSGGGGGGGYSRQGPASGGGFSSQSRPSPSPSRDTGGSMSTSDRPSAGANRPPDGARPPDGTRSATSGGQSAATASTPTSATAAAAASASLRRLLRRRLGSLRQLQRRRRVRDGHGRRRRHRRGCDV